jgi:hypothetical protein
VTDKARQFGPAVRAELNLNSGLSGGNVPVFLVHEKETRPDPAPDNCYEAKAGFSGMCKPF